MTTTYRVLVSDSIAPEGLEVLRQSGVCQVDVRTGLQPAALCAIIGEYDALVVRSMTPVTADVFAQAHRLKVIGHAGVGADNIDVAAATAHGTLVMHTPVGGEVSVAELVIGLMFALARHIPQAAHSIGSGQWQQAGKWQRAEFLGQELQGQTLGILGLGATGRLVAAKAHALGMRVIGHDPVVAPEQAHGFGVQWVDFDHVLGGCNILTVHVPLVATTQGLLNRNAFAKMKTGALLIHTARGGILVHADLREALTSGHLGGAALDLFETWTINEAQAVDQHRSQRELYELPQVLCTPCLGIATRQAQDKISLQIAHQIIEFLRDGTVTNAVNPLT